MSDLAERDGGGGGGHHLVSQLVLPLSVPSLVLLLGCCELAGLVPSMKEVVVQYQRARRHVVHSQSC